MRKKLYHNCMYTIIEKGGNKVLNIDCLYMVEEQSWHLYLKQYSEISGRLKTPFSLTPIDRYSLGKLIVQSFHWLWFYIGEICGITWIVFLHWTCWILYLIFMPGHREIKNLHRSAYFVITVLFLLKSYWSEVSIGEFFQNIQ